MNPTPPLFSDVCRRLGESLKVLPDKPEETPESTARALWLAAAGTPRSVARAMHEPLPPLDARAQAELEQLVGQRLEGVPLAHITGRQEFMDLEMLCGPGALVPRRETELLGRAVLDLVRDIGRKQQHVTLVDVCTGCGNVALAAAGRVSNVRAFAADLSADAVSLARRNAAHLGLEQRVEFRCGDLLAPFDEPQFLGRVDVLSCNPPYISSARVGQMDQEISKYEPHLAFDGGPFGVAILMRLLQEAPRFLRDGGWLAFEVGLGQGPGMAKRLAKSGNFTDIQTCMDSAGAPRAIFARLTKGAASA